jgi:selenoprotein W-related protein
LTTKLLNQFKMGIKELTLIPYKGGCFELTVNGELIYSKLETGKFPDEKWALETVAKKVKVAG